VPWTAEVIDSLPPPEAETSSPDTEPAPPEAFPEPEALPDEAPPQRS
jgi:hypothetical protein